MASTQSTMDYLLDQMAGAGGVRCRKMFGEYAVYCEGKVVALVCDDRLYVKPTEAGRQFIGSVTEAFPFPGAKPWFLINEERWEEREWLSGLILKTAEALTRTRGKT